MLPPVHFSGPKRASDQKETAEQAGLGTQPGLLLVTVPFSLHSLPHLIALLWFASRTADRHPWLMASWQGASAGADVCPICLERLSSETVSLGCGHLLHLNCLSGLSQCPMCRGPIDPDRIKLAGAVPAAAGPAGGFVGYAVRSAAPQRPPPTGGAGAGAAGQQHPIPAPAATRLDASDAPAATDIPPAYRDLLLFGIMRQLGAAADASHGLPAQAPAARAYVPYGMGLLGPFNAAPAAGAHAGQPMAPNTWAFCIDVSSEAGRGGRGVPGAGASGHACSARSGRCVAAPATVIVRRAGMPFLPLNP